MPTKKKKPSRAAATKKRATKPARRRAAATKPAPRRAARRFVDDARTRGAAAPSSEARDESGELKPGVEIELVPTPEGETPVRRRFSAF